MAVNARRNNQSLPKDQPEGGCDEDTRERDNALFGSVSDGARAPSRRRDPSWSGWSFNADIEFAEPVNIDSVIDAATDKP